MDGYRHRIMDSLHFRRLLSCLDALFDDFYFSIG